MRMRPGKRRKLDPGSAEAAAEKASVRAKVEHPFLKVKRIFDYGKVRYRGMAKNSDTAPFLPGRDQLVGGGALLLVMGPDARLFHGLHHGCQTDSQPEVQVVALLWPCEGPASGHSPGKSWPW